MHRLDDHLLAYLFKLLETRDMLACAATCRQWNHIVHTTAELQLELRQSLHQSGLYHGETSYPIGERLRRLVTRETNIDLLRPRVTKFQLPKDQVIHTVSGKYVITQPADDEQRMGEDNKYEICTIWVRNVPKKVKVDFKPFTDLIDLDIHQDVLIVQVDQGPNNLNVKSDILLRVFHLFNEDEDAVEYDGGGMRITEREWVGPEPHNISLTEGGRVMVWCDGVVWLYDWKECQPIGRLPPIANIVWRSNLGMAWAGEGIILGLDMPHNPDTDLVQNSTLAIFEVDTTYPGTSSLPLLLELPFCLDLLTETARELLGLSDSDVITMDDEHIPHISRNGPYGLIVVATEFTINETIAMRLVVVLPVANLQSFELEKTRRTPNPFHAWGNEWDPFGDLHMVSFGDWRQHAYTWAEPKISESYHHGFYEAQHSLRLYSYNYHMLQRHGLLQLKVLDFNQKRLRGSRNDFHTLGGLGQEGSVENEKDNSARREPSSYRRTIIEATPNNMGCVEIRGDFMLGVDARANVFTFCGERLFIQQRDRDTAWILDFGVKEIAGKEGEQPHVEDESSVHHATGPPGGNEQLGEQERSGSASESLTGSIKRKSVADTSSGENEPEQSAAVGPSKIKRRGTDDRDQGRELGSTETTAPAAGEGPGHGTGSV
ncbi:hypothetical protein I316_05262 [Kwoniella heveanensis BCC8398]|uniref:F-box domain-containing protein n=1 Tax=Kwoniella heveanensis BCC8398 TaxID=1296120 RepID=A0A1B9GQ20_9TREE|nr:hypothetical protein I316_05262 [Kwoniella heveanensis BCC8398]